MLKPYSFFTGLLLLLLFASCKKDNTDANAQLSGVEKALIQSNNELGFKVLAALDSSAATNPVVAPSALGKTFGLLINGADGNTRSSLQQSLGINTLSPEDMNQGYKDLDSYLLHADGNVSALQGIGIWFKAELTAKTAFVQLNELYYKANIGYVNLQDGSGQNAINQWAASSTGNQIEQIYIPNYDRDALALATDASAFSAPWAVTFNADRTQSIGFTLADGSSTRAMMMHEPSLSYKYYSDNEVVVADIPMGSGNYHYSLILPTDTTNNGIKSLLNNVTLAKWNHWVANLDSTDRPDLFFPKTDLNSAVSLNSAINALYLGSSFDANASYANLSIDKVFPDDIIQQSHLKIDEKGIDQAKSIDNGIVPTNSPALYFNRPFVFCIWENTSGAILFLGKVNNPNSN